MSERSRPREKIFAGYWAISKCEVRALEEEYLAPRAKEGKSLWLRSQKRNWMRGSPTALTLQHKDELARAALRFAFESARFPLDSMKSYGSFLSRPLDGVHGGSTIPQSRHHDQDTALR